MSIGLDSCDPSGWQQQHQKQSLVIMFIYRHRLCAEDAFQGYNGFELT